MDERMAMMRSWVSGDYWVSELAAEYGVSRKTTYKWIERYEAHGWVALRDQSRAPRHHPNAVSAEVQQALLELKERWPLWGAPKLRRKLELALGAQSCPAESTVSEILRRHGLSRIARRRRRATPSAQPFAACQEANAVWCADFKGWFRTGDGAKCTPLTISDGHSRYLLRCQGLDGSTGFTTVQPLFVATFREYGLPRAMRTDNGPPFASTGLGGLSALSVWWVRLGLELQRIEPGSTARSPRPVPAGGSLPTGRARLSVTPARTTWLSRRLAKATGAIHRPNQMEGPGYLPRPCPGRTGNRAGTCRRRPLENPLRTPRTRTLRRTQVPPQAQKPTNPQSRPPMTCLNRQICNPCPREFLLPLHRNIQ
jgi:transposase